MSKYRLIKRTFVRQLSNDDCGIACLCMILNYSGQADKATELKGISPPQGGLSLWDLSLIGNEYGLSCRAVEMDYDFLACMDRPCILHLENDLGNGHFQVCYGSVASQKEDTYFLADPANQVHLLKKTDLIKRWKSGAALYFDELKPDLAAFRKPAWRRLFDYQPMPIPLICVFPLFAVTASSFGIALSMFLERARSHDELTEGRIFYCLSTVLFLIGLMQVLSVYLRQHLLVSYNLSLYRLLIRKLVSRLEIIKGSRQWRKETVDHCFVDIQKIQNAISIFLSVIIPDGFMLIILLSLLIYMVPVVGICCLLLTILACKEGFRDLRSKTYMVPRLNELSSTLREKAYLIVSNDHSNRMDENSQGLGETTLRLQECYHDTALKLTGISNKASLYCDGIHIVNVMACSWCMFKAFKNGSFPFSQGIAIVFISYMTGAILKRIIAAITVVYEGADAAIQFDWLLL